MVLDSIVFIFITNFHFLWLNITLFSLLKFRLSLIARIIFESIKKFIFHPFHYPPLIKLSPKITKNPSFYSFSYFSHGFPKSTISRPPISTSFLRNTTLSEPFISSSFLKFYNSNQSNNKKWLSKLLFWLCLSFHSQIVSKFLPMRSKPISSPKKRRRSLLNSENPTSKMSIHVTPKTTSVKSKSVRIPTSWRPLTRATLSSKKSLMPGWKRPQKKIRETQTISRLS